MEYPALSNAPVDEIMIYFADGSNFKAIKTGINNYLSTELPRTIELNIIEGTPEITYVNISEITTNSAKISFDIGGFDIIESAWIDLWTSSGQFVNVENASQDSTGRYNVYLSNLESKTIFKAYIKINY